MRAALKGTGAIREVRMFGGIGFMVNGDLVAAASRRGLLLRIGKDRETDALAQSGARPMVMRGRTMEGYVYVDPPELSIQTVQKGLRMAVATSRRSPRRRKLKPNREKENGNEDAFRTWSPRLPRA